MNDAQQRKYLFEWGKVRRKLRETMTPSQADAQRHAMHVKALGFDKSSTLLTNKEFDLVLKEFFAITKPISITAQIEQDEMASTRKRHTIRQLLRALDYAESEIELRIDNRHRASRLVTVTKDAIATFETIGLEDLERLMLDLKRDCRRRWPRKGDLLTEIRLIRMEHEFDEETTAATIREALHWQSALPFPPVDRLDYEQLLTVIATLRGLMTADMPF